MSPFAQTSFAHHPSSLVRTQSVRLWMTTHTNLLNIVTLALLVVVTFGYIVQVNSTASKGYAIRDLQTNIDKLASANQDMQGDMNQAQSLQNITHAVKMIGMVQAGQPTYLNTNGATYAFAAK